MKRFVESVVLSVTFLTGLSMAQAAEQAPSRGERSSTDRHRHDMRFSGGKFYAGREHNHWKSCYFEERSGCYLYLDPSTRDYYYWCERDDCFYPVSYCPYGTYNFGAGRVCSTCPIMKPTHPPITFGGNPPRGPTHPPITFGGNPPRGPSSPPITWGGNPPRGPVTPPKAGLPPYRTNGPWRIESGLTNSTSGNSPRQSQSLAAHGGSAGHSK
jgi:hypothetical protein